MAYTTINKSTDYFNTKLWTGTGSNGNAISGVGFAPDWVWVKNRSGTYDHVLFDRVRGDNKHIESNNNSGEENESNTLAFGSDGYSVGTNTLNNSGDNIVGWNWKAGGAGSANTDGSISSTVSVNTTAGFSIVKYSNGGGGATVGHGLGVVPSMIIVKRIDDSGYDWVVYHKHDASGLYLNSTSNNNDSSSSNIWFNGAAPTSTVFTCGSDGRMTGSGKNFVAYCFAEKKGYSSFEYYIGNNNANGTFVYTGFKPKFLMVKQANANGNPWGIVDATRNTGNITKNQLFANTNGTENTSVDVIDLLSNGFKCRAADNTWNGEASSGKVYIYMAIGQSLVGSNNVPCTAR